MKNKTLTIIAFMILLVMVSACGIAGSLKTISDNGNAFMRSIKEQTNEVSWSLLTPAVQEEIGGKEAWAEFTAPRQFQDWKFAETKFENNTGSMTGTANFETEVYDVLLVFEKVDNEWLISGINFSLHQ